MVREYQHRSSAITRLVLSIGIVIAIIVISGFAFQRFDLTAEKRHTLTSPTKELLENLQDVVFIKVYLKGDYPADFKRLERATQDRLDEMKVYAGNNLEYEFIDPSANEDEKIRLEEYQKLEEQGLMFTSLQLRTKDGIAEKIIFPGALITYQEKTLPVQILKSRELMADAQMINNSINNLEYDFTSGIRQIISKTRKKIAFIEGHGELREIDVFDVTTELKENYTVDRVRIDGQLNMLTSEISKGYREKKYDLIIIAKPDSVFEDKDKFLIDQYLMKGGKIIWLLDPINANLDSLRDKQQSIGIPNEIDLSDQLFQYGIKLNRNLILDRNCAPIAINTGQFGNQPKLEYLPWYFKPLVTGRRPHPIVSNLDPIALDFVSSLDTVAKPGIRKTVLLSSSENSRFLRAPVRINLNITRIDPNFGELKTPFQPVAILLEGEFVSSYKDRLPPEVLENEQFAIDEISKPTSMLVVSDGDIIKNGLNYSTKSTYPLGYDRIAGRKIYGNKEFFLNAVNYMLDDKSLISIRSRTIKLRQLNQEYLLQNRSLIQFSNVALPLVLVIVFGWLQGLFRRRKYNTST